MYNFSFQHSNVSTRDGQLMSTAVFSRSVAQQQQPPNQQLDASCGDQSTLTTSTIIRTALNQAPNDASATFLADVIEKTKRTLKLSEFDTRHEWNHYMFSLKSDRVKKLYAP